MPRTFCKNHTTQFPMRRFQNSRYSAATMTTDKTTLPHTRRMSLE